MPDHNLLQQLRAERSGVEAIGRQLGVDIRRKHDALLAATRAGDTVSAEAERAELVVLRQRRTKSGEKEAALAAEIEKARDDFDPTLFPDLASRISELGADLPIALLPVRIETRFLPHGDQPPTHLWIRIYPDDVHIDTHEPELTEIEIKAAEVYWAEVAVADEDAATIDAAWARLSAGFEPNRAKWIVRATQPGLDGIPRLDQVPRKDGPWTRAPVARALPERFVAMGYVSGQRVFTEWGSHIPDRLQAGLEPDLDDDDTVEQLGSPPAEQADLPIDDGMRWLVDLDDAKRQGMAIAVELGPAFAEGLDRVVVFGVRAADEPAVAAGLLEELLESQRFTEGLAVLRTGAPTNNTAAERSATTSQRPRVDPLRKRAGSPSGASTETVGRATANALGINPAAIGDIDGADRVEQVAEMHAALWSATLGYYAEQLLLPLLNDRTVSRLHDHFVAYVRGRGPLPALRIGNQPYGLLPVMIPGRLRSSAGDISRPLESFLSQIRGFWTDAVDRTPRLGRTGDPVRDLVEVLGQTPTTKSVIGRPVVGRHLLENILRHGVKSPIPEAGMEAHRVMAEMLLNGVGVKQSTIRLASMTAIDTSYPIRRPLVGRGQLSETEAVGFIAAIDAELGHPDTVRRLRALPPPKALLDLLLRHAALMSMGSVATGLNLTAKGRPSRVLMEAEFVDVETADGVTATPLRLIDRPVDQVTGGRTVAEVIARGDSGLATHLQPWREFKDGLEGLAAVPAAELDRLFRDLLDVLSHRLDAWYTSLATRRLEALRNVTPTGVYVGAFGFVEKLRPEFPDAVTADGSGEVVELSSNAGYVHAPSMAHASTAAILRSGFLAHGGSQDDLLALDLSSARVRRGLEVIRGIREGESLGAVLGYRIERLLRDRQLGQYIRPLRVAAPLVVDVTGAVDEAEAVIAGSVVDGERIVELSGEGGLFAGGSAPFPANDPNRSAVEAIVAEVADIVDALADMLLAESVHQTVRGDGASAAAALAAVDYGATPPDPDVVRTPRTGVGLTHRVAVLFDPAAGPATGWPAGLRSMAEPGVDRWVGLMLGPPVRFEIEALYRTEDAAEIGRETFTLADVGLSASDVIGGLQRGAQGEASELEARLLRHASSLRSGLPELVREQGDTAVVDGRSLDELFGLAEQLAKIVARSRPADAADLTTPDEGAASDGLDVGAMRQRAEGVEARFRGAVTVLRDAVSAGAAAAVDDARAAFADFGVPGSLVEGGNVPESVEDLIVSLDAGVALDVAAPEELVARIELIFGGTVRVMPEFRVANPSELAVSRSQSTLLQNGDPFAAAGFLSQAGLVREGVERLAKTMLYVETIGGAEPSAELRVVQLPHVAGDRWIALEFSDELTPSASLAVVMHDPDTVDFASNLAGLVVDEWNEVVPRGSEITGVSFHYDQPDATAPNAILIGVHPGDAKAWDLATLEATVLESIELTKMRSVDTDDLKWVARFLPLLYFPDNLAGDTAAVDLLRMATREAD